MNFISKISRVAYHQIVPSYMKNAVRCIHNTSIGNRMFGRILDTSKDIHKASAPVFYPQNAATCKHLHTVCKPQINIVQRHTNKETLLTPPVNNLQFTRTYKAKTVLKLRCSSCYFVRRPDRLYVECTAKPRHKQMQKLNKANMFVEDYSKGKVVAGTWYRFRTKNSHFYRLGNTPYTRKNWLGDRIADI